MYATNPEEVGHTHMVSSRLHLRRFHFGTYAHMTIALSVLSTFSSCIPNVCTSDISTFENFMILIASAMYSNCE